jgi:hypothetical protein
MRPARKNKTVVGGGAERMARSFSPELRNFKNGLGLQQGLLSTLKELKQMT